MTKSEPGCDTEFTLPIAVQKRPTGTASLVHIHPPGPGAGRRHTLDGTPLLIGRVEGCDICLNEHAVSRRHACIDLVDGIYSVRDLDSTNGTRVNDQPVGSDPRPLRDGDYLQIGNYVFRFLAGGNVEAEYHEELYRRTFQDALTRLHNRRALNEFLERELIRSQRYNRPVSVILFDLDRFKAVNDSHGHLCGDHVIREVADLLRAVTRGEDICARYGGEEFALVLVEADHFSALAVAERVRTLVNCHAFRFEGVELALTISAGVATTCGDRWATTAGLLHEADERLYAAKREGRNRVVGEPAREDDAGAMSTWVVT
ncbi:GGDEF domain-containing protein [Frigoriglobus tundricola]|uniref:diguanylate cyclase n=1 Tax=Frigoriglobus tundricola TaxID=2774151 RepID=A0A6M5Z3M0_9BACT|nr:GGDEF domain-containing protein [Frigoriglobus tundricola]QJX00869.1 diguanylate cyclase (GGDEF domain) with PAS/PAC sensor [Frigoriglobus tundricola]